MQLDMFAAPARTTRRTATRAASRNQRNAGQMDLFATADATPAVNVAPKRPADVQMALFRPDFSAMQAPKAKGKAAPKPIALDPALHDGGLF